MNINKRNYIICLIIFAFFFSFFNFLLIFVLHGQFDQYILPGDGKLEWIFGINMIIVSILFSGILSLYIGIPFFLKAYVKSIGKKQQIGLVTEKELRGSQHLLKLWLRGIVLGFFISNIAYTLVSNQSFVMSMMNPEEIARQLEYLDAIIIPDPSLMLLIIWIIAIPCTCILVPIWFMIDVGLVATKRIRGFEFSSVNLASSYLYKIIKGYAGIGFVYNLIILIYEWIFHSGFWNITIFFAQILSPFGIISATFPFIILMDSQKWRFKARLEKTLIKLDLNKDLKCNVQLSDR